ncbi:unnamed protein product [Closterium sp. Naga37s-1]|nr:unnamed protein product [Closterium sp. Naga37s-1]
MIREARMTGTEDSTTVSFFSRPGLPGRIGHGVNEEDWSVSNTIPHPDVVVWAKGLLHERLEAVCAGYALHQLLSSKLSPAVPSSSSQESQDSQHPQQQQQSQEAQQAPLRLAVLWLPDAGMPHATLNHVLGPLPRPSVLSYPQGAQQQNEGQRQQQQQQQQKEASSGAADSADETLVLLHHPSWLNSPLYTYGILNSKLPQPKSQEQMQQQQEQETGNSSSSSSSSSPSSSSSHPSRRLHVNFFLSASLPPMASALADVDGSQLHTSLQRCYSLLQPSTAVQELIAKENMTRVQQSTAVYVEPISLSLPSSYPCSSCDPKIAVNCTTRRLMWFFLGQPEGDATVVGFWPSQAVAVAETFHENRQPHLLESTRRRAQQCEGGNRNANGNRMGGGNHMGNGNRIGGGYVAPPIIPPGLTVRQQTAKWMWWLGLADGRDYYTAGTGGLGGGARGEVGGKVGVEKGRGGANGTGESAGGTRRLLLSDGVEGGSSSSWRRRRLEGLIHLQHSPQADLIRAQASAKGSFPRMRDVLVAPESFPRGEVPPGIGGDRGGAGNEGEEGRVFEEERGLCDAPKILPVTEHRIGRQLIVDEDVGMVYCYVQKAGCTSWKFWLREQHHHPFPKSFLSAHTAHFTNVTAVWYSLTEPQAIRSLTRRDFTRFVFLRNPYTRVLSAYLDKMLRGGGPDDLGAGFWAQAFFGQLVTHSLWDVVTFRSGPGTARLRSIWEVIQLRTGFRITFDEFVDFLGEAWEIESRFHLDVHIVPQTLLCALDRIKYDFVGRFENMDEDVMTLMRRFGREPGDAFSFGKKLQKTKSRGRLSDAFANKVRRWP